MQFKKHSFSIPRLGGQKKKKYSSIFTVTASLYSRDGLRTKNSSCEHGSDAAHISRRIIASVMSSQLEMHDRHEHFQSILRPR